MAYTQVPTKMRWWYDAIIDWMIANPDKTLADCAADLKKSPQWIRAIYSTDFFKEALAQRRAEFATKHDFGIIEKTTKIAHQGLDAILETLENKRDKIPLAVLNDITDGALKRLGYGTEEAKSPAAQVNVTTVQQTVIAPVSRSDLEEARAALRTVQQAKKGIPPPPEPKVIEAKPSASVPTIEEILRATDPHAA